MQLASVLSLSLVLPLSIARADAASPKPPPERPVKTFFQVPTMAGLEFSPDGRKVLFLTPYNRRLNLAVVDLEKKSKTLLSNFDDKDAIAPFWVNDERIFFFVDEGGREEGELYAVNADGSDPSNLVVDRPVTRLLGRLKDDPKNILVEAGITHRDWPDVTRMNVKTGRLGTPIARAPGPVRYYVLDHEDEVRVAALSETHTRTQKVLYRASNGQEWDEIASFEYDAPNWVPLAFDGDNRTLFVLSDLGRKTRALYRYDTQTRTLEIEPVFADDTHDVSGVVFDDWKNRVVGVVYDADRRRFHWFDPEMAAIQQRLEQALPDTVHSPVQFAEDGSSIIYFSYSDRDPGVYYIYDRKRQKVSELGIVNPEIDPAEMARMKPIRYKARDGLTLHGYLTLPVGRDAKNLPLVINPHGGPYGIRDTWGFNPEVQFLANRGFAVLQVNYRGSGGYGQWFETAGHKKWGLEMQNDLTDGVRWAIAQGIADPKRVVIAGASYGGYATMAGLVYTPELYCAGINYVGVVDIKDLLPKGVASSQLYWFNTRIGDLANAADRNRIEETSPVNFVGNIRAPLLMAYGKNDPRVRVTHAYDIERALKRADKPYTLLIEEDEGHGFSDESKRIAFYTEVDSFLKRHVLDK